MAQSESDCAYNSQLEDNPFLEENEKGRICPLCLRNGIYFYCEKCIRNGSFTHSKDKTLERFAEKKLKLYKLNEQKTRLLHLFGHQLYDTINLENLQFQLCSQKQMNLYLKSHLKNIRKNTKKMESMIRHFKEKNENLEKRMPMLRARIAKMEEEAELSRTTIGEGNGRLKQLESFIQLARQHNIEQLVRYIFPISKTKKDERNLQYFDPDSDLDAIYVTGQWELAGESTSSGYEYNIIESSIPANGNYSAYTDWSLKNAEELNLAEDQELRNSAYSIVTSLSFVAHLVTIIGSYLDAYMPKHLTHSEFSGREFNKEVFLHKVAKLNANVIHLCLSQNVDPSLIRPHHTLDNLMLLLEVDDLGRSGPVETWQRLPEYLEDHLASDLMLIDEREENILLDDLPSDWVQVNEFTDIDPTLICEFGTLTGLPQQTSYRPSLTGDLISSVSSLWRAATWQK